MALMNVLTSLWKVMRLACCRLASRVPPGRIGMRTSKFCLHPAGDTPSACRMFDAIVNLCVPVVVSDSIELPFEDVLDYRSDLLLRPTVGLRPLLSITPLLQFITVGLESITAGLEFGNSSL